METFILNLLESIGKIDFSFVWQIFAYSLIVFWFVVLYWVWLDSGERTSNKTVRYTYVLLVAVLNVIGWVIYLIIRPSQTIEEIYWGDLERRYLKYETAELGDCPKCGTQLYPGYQFCPSCKYKLRKKCSGCGVSIDKKNKFCPFCGTEVQKRLSPDQESPTKEVMEEQIKANKEEVTGVVEGNKTRYTRKSSFTVKIGESIVGGYKIIIGKTKTILSKVGEFTGNLFKKTKKKKE